MTADRRNGLVVVTLVLSLCAGVGVLLLLEPGDHQVDRAPLLMAERGALAPIATIAILYAASVEEAAPFISTADGDAVCVVYPTGAPEWYPGGPHVRLVVLGAPGQTHMGEEQQKALLAALRELVHGRDASSVRIELVPPVGATSDSDWPPAAQEVRELLIRKRLLPD